MGQTLLKINEMMRKINHILFAILMFLALTGTGCSLKDKQSEEAEKAYAQFVKQRERMRYGADLETIQKALKYYPAFRKSLSAGDIVGFRRQAKTDSLDFTEFMPTLFMIMEIDDSSKTPSGRKYLEKKYNSKIIAYIQTELMKTRSVR